MSEKNQAATPRKTPSAQFGGKGLSIAIIIAAILAVGGIILWGIQLTQGLVVSNMRDFDSWGLYITCFMFFVGLSAGGLIISSIPRAFGMEGFGGISKVAVWTSICCTILAVAFVVIDLGHPLRLWELFAYSNLGSPLMWDIAVISVYLILSIIYLWATLRAESGKVSQTALRTLSVIALITAILVHSVTAWIFGLQPAHEFWYTALLAPWFVSSALVCGTALVLVVVVGLRKAGYMQVEQKYIVKMMKMLGSFVAVDLYFFACDLLTAGFPGGEGAQVVDMLVFGPLAPFFWAEIALCTFTLIVAFVPPLRRNGLLVVAAIASIIAIFCKRVQLLIGGFQIANIDMPGVLTESSITNWTSGLTGAYEGMVYWPSGIEFGVAMGVLGLGTFILLLGIKYLPLKPVEGSH